MRFAEACCASASSYPIVSFYSLTTLIRYIIPASIRVGLTQTDNFGRKAAPTRSTRSIMTTGTHNLILQFQAAWSIFLLVVDIARYTFTYPWRDSCFSISQTLADPDQYLDQWIQVRRSEYSSIGLVVSVKTRHICFNNYIIQTISLFCV